MLHPPDDSSLLSDFRDTRSESAFTELVRRHLPLVFQVALRRLGSAALAQEAAQNAFTRLAAKAAAVSRHPERLRAWLHRTAYFEASTLARKESRLSKVPVIPDPEPMNRPEIYDRLDEALNKLPELDRELVLRHCCGGEDYRHMAGATGKSEAACQKRVERALARLAQGMGGAKTAGAVVTAFAASSVKLPAAETIAAAALKQHAAASGVAGAISGAKVAACAALALAGGATGWQQRPAAATAPPQPSLSSTVALPSAERKMTVSTAEVALAPPPVSIDRSLDDVLESILAGRLGPLVEFLPQATVADLRAIMAEDDIGDLAEGMGGFGTAHDLAARRWVEIEPAAAFYYGFSRSTGLATRMLARWMETDPRGAASAFVALPVNDQQALARDMVRLDDGLAGELAAISSDVAWIVEEHRLTHPAPLDEHEKAELLIAGLLDGKRSEEPGGAEISDTVDAFQRLARKDRETVLKRAALIPWPALRAQVLAGLGQPLQSEDLPPGAMRSAVLAEEADRLMSSDPEAAIARLKSAAPGNDRDKLAAAVSKHLMGTDPWRLLEISASLDGPLKGVGISPALTAAGRSDPRRALAMLPDLSHHFTAFEGLREYVSFVLSGWIENDVIEATRWAAEAGIRLDSGAFERCSAPPETLLKLFSDPNEKVRAMGTEALRQPLKAAIAEGTAEKLLDRMPADAADDLLEWIAVEAGQRGSHDEALAIARMATSTAKSQEVLPRVGLYALRHDPDLAVAWIRSLPDDERQAVIDGVERIVGGPQYGGGDADKLREALQPLMAP